ncbi:MAG: CPBP family intramembrane metalloprotease [Rhodospirillaceae bacterium]|nr:CPBP family intramembrane metalloprotease [Rhodospirillaceae bacterium]
MRIKESKALSADRNPLENKGFPEIRGTHVLIFLILCPALAMGALFQFRPEAGGGGFLLTLAMLFAAGLVSVVLAVSLLGGAALPALGFRPAGWRPIVFGSLGTLALSVAVSQLGIQPEGMKQAMNVSREPALFLAAFAVMAVLAPLVEELVFRGLLYGWLESRWNSRVAFVVSSLVFAVAHYELAHIVLVLPLGLLFGYLRRRTNSLLPSLVAHVANNTLAVVAAAFLAP